MGVWEWMSSSTATVTDLLHRNTPDVTPVTEACRKSYEIGRAVTVQADGAVRTKARELYDYVSDDQVRDNATRLATNLSKNGALFLARSYGGGPIIDIVSRSVQERKADSQKERLAEMEAKLAKLERELSSRKTIEQAEHPRASMAWKAQDEPDFNSNKDQRPEDLLNTFMMTQFVGTKLLEDLIVPGTRSRRKERSDTGSDGQYK